MHKEPGKSDRKDLTFLEIVNTSGTGERRGSGVRNCLGQTVRTARMESFRSLLKPGSAGIHRKMFPQHLDKSVNAFVRHRNSGDKEIIGRIGGLGRSMAGKPLTFSGPIAGTLLPGSARA